MYSQRSYTLFSKWLLLFVLTASTGVVHAQEAFQDTSVSSHENVYDQLEEKDSSDEEEEDDDYSYPVLPSLRTVPDSTVKNLKASKEFEYANDPEYWKEQGKKKKTKRPPRQTEEREFSMFEFSGVFGIAKLVLLLLVAAVLGFLIYKLMGNRWPWEARAKLKEDAAAAAEEINTDELQLKIQEAIRLQQYRMAVRYCYLFTLRKLDDKGWIQLDPKSTNQDYLKQMRTNDPNGSFAYLTNVYDYVWYGEFELNEEQFKLVYNDFQKYLNTCGH